MKQRIRIFSLFVSHYFTHMRRKWKSLPLLLLFPFFIIGFTAIGLISFFIQPEDEPIQVGLIDYDQSEETEMIITAFIEGTELGEFIKVIPIQEDDAEEMIHNEKLSAYIAFPQGFTSNLYHGNHVHIPVTGSGKHPLQSQLIYEFVQSVMRHIETAQASILTIYSYAKELPMDHEEQTDMLFDEFKAFFFDALNKDEILRETTMQNKATFSPTMYFSVAILFFTSIVWSFLFYLTLYKETSPNLLMRMKIYGVRSTQLISSRIFVSYIFSFICTTGLFFLMRPFLFEHMDQVSSSQIVLLLALCLSVFMIGLGIIDLVSPSIQFTMTIQLIYLGLCIIGSGALIPRMYFPMRAQPVLDHFFSTYTFDKLLHIMIFDGVFISYQLLWISLGISIVIYGSISIWKARVNQ